MLAQTVTFSFLSFNCSNGALEPSLVPSIGITPEQLIVHMYDCVEDVLLCFCPLDIVSNKKLNIRAVLLLWLVLNYKLFCAEVPDKYKQYTSNFHQKLGPDFLKIYQTEVTRPLHTSIGLKDREEYPAPVPGVDFPTETLAELGLLHCHVESIEIDLNDTDTD